MQRIAIIFLVVFSFVLLQKKSFGRQPVLEDILIADFQQNSLGVSGGQLYVHMDKSMYVNNENIWFKASLLKAADSVNSYHTLFVVLTNKISNKVVASEAFVMGNGLAAGYLFLPDSLGAGPYNFIAYTNKLPDSPYPAIFQQEIMLVNPRTAEAYQISFHANNTIIADDSISFLCKIINQQAAAVKDVQLQYKVWANDSLVSTGTGVVNQYGELPIRFNYTTTYSGLEWEAMLIDKKDTFFLRQPLTLLDEYAQFKFYPESGHWIDGIFSVTAFEINSLSGKPLSLVGQVLEDGIAITSFRTNAAGQGILSISPKAGKEYTIKLQESKVIIREAAFPIVKASGYQLVVAKAVTADTLTVVVHKKNAANGMQLALHNYEELFALIPLNQALDKITVKIPVIDLPAGLATLTLFDVAQNPVAERTVFLKDNQRPVVEIKMDSSRYHQRSKVKVKMIVKDAQGNPLQGFFSMAAISYKRIDTTSFQDIVPYYYLNNYIQHKIIPRSSLYSLGAVQDIEMFLLTKCWTKYHPTRPIPFLPQMPSAKALEVTGWVEKRGKKLKKPVELFLFSSGESFFSLTTDSVGRFSIPAEWLAVEGGQYVNVMLSGAAREEYDIIFDTERKQVEQAIAQHRFSKTLQVRAALPVEEFPLQENIKTLSTVVVKTKTENTTWGGEYKSINCNDFVCMYNILNCPNHPNSGTRPIHGQTYSYRGKMVVYKSCQPEKEKQFFSKIKGRSFTKEFYKADYDVYNPTLPEILSTIYWEPHFVTNEAGEAEISFFTNDLKGVFVCMIQGLTDNGVISNKKLFTVIGE